MLPAASVTLPITGVHTIGLLLKNLKVNLGSPQPLPAAADSWSLNQPPPMLAKNTPRMPPMTPIGVNAASISGKRSSAFANTTFCPENCR